MDATELKKAKMSGIAQKQYKKYLKDTKGASQMTEDQWYEVNYGKGKLTDKKAPAKWTDTLKANVKKELTKQNESRQAKAETDLQQAGLTDAEIRRLKGK
jgi:hypothetical protein